MRKLLNEKSSILIDVDDNAKKNNVQHRQQNTRSDRAGTIAQFEQARIIYISMSALEINQVASYDLSTRHSRRNTTHFVSSQTHASRRSNEKRL